MSSTAFMGKLERNLKKLSAFCLGMGAIGMFLMIIVIFIDIVGVSAIKKPVYGGGEIVAITQLLAISFAIPTGLFQDIFPSVTLLTDLFGPGMKKFFAVLNSAICMILFLLMTGMTFKLAHEYQASDELIANINLPFYPFVYITGFAFVIAAIVWLLKCLLLLSPSAKGGDL
jgi:TRAP-type C4-dicarboxylate transport system permease small subunit